MTRRLRFASALVALAAMLFAPFALALQSCERVDAMAGSGMALMAHMGTTGNPDCERHCSAIQAAALAKTLPAFIAPPVASVGRLHPAVHRLVPATVWRAPAFLADPSPPLSRFTVLRL